MQLPTVLVLVGVPLGSVPSHAAPQNACAGKVVMSFPLAAAGTPVLVHLGRAFVLQAVPGDGAWELGVYRSGDTGRGDNLLAPSGNWHGAQAFQVTPYMASIYPNERVMPIRLTSTSICVGIQNARIEGGEYDRCYVDGVIEVRWSRARG